MRKVVLNVRRPDLTREQFSRHWGETHAALLSSIPSYREFSLSYVQNHVAGPGPRGDAFPYDGVSDIEQAEIAGAAPFAGTQVYREVVIPDEEAFLDRDATLVFLARKKQIVPGRGATKVMIFSRRAAHLTHEEYVRYWSTHHVDVVLGQRDLAAFIRGYVQSYVVEGSFKALSGKAIADPQPYDGMIELWFDSPDAAREAFATEGYRTAVRADEPNFLSVGRSIAFIADERAYF